MTHTNLNEISFQFSDIGAAREFVRAMDEQGWTVEREGGAVTIETCGGGAEALAAASRYFAR